MRDYNKEALHAELETEGRYFKQKYRHRALAFMGLATAELAQVTPPVFSNAAVDFIRDNLSLSLVAQLSTVAAIIITGVATRHCGNRSDESLRRAAMLDPNNIA